MKDADFIARVRRHRPSALLPLLAAFASRHMDKASWFRAEAVGFGAPWALAEIARVSLAYSNEHRRDAVGRDVVLCNDAYNQLEDPELAEGYDGPVAGFFLRLTEQLEYQRPQLHELGRPVALLAHTEPTKPMAVLRPGWEEELFSTDLVSFCAAGFLLYAACAPNEGRFNPKWLAQDNMRFVLDAVPEAELLEVWRRHFVGSVDDVTSLNGRPPASAIRRFAFNPLVRYPVLTGLGDDWLIPVPNVLARRMSMLGIYHAGLEKWGTAFSDDLGNLFETYIGRNLDLLDGAFVTRETSYGKSRSDTIDYIVVLPEIVVLVEVKSVRPTQPIRVGDAGKAASELQRMLAKGVRQLRRDDRLIDDEHEAFTNVPRDRPRVGLLVTMEEFHIINSPFYRDLFMPDGPGLPVAVVSAAEIEHWVTLTDTTPGQLLLGLVQQPHPTAGLSLKTALIGHTHRANTVIGAGWAAGHWPQLPTGLPAGFPRRVGRVGARFTHIFRQAAVGPAG